MAIVRHSIVTVPIHNHQGSKLLRGVPYTILWSEDSGYNTHYDVSVVYPYYCVVHYNKPYSTCESLGNTTERHIGSPVKCILYCLPDILTICYNTTFLLSVALCYQFQRRHGEKERNQRKEEEVSQS